MRLKYSMRNESRRAAIPGTVWALGFVSLFMDVSSEIVHALLPLFLTTTLGASVIMVGLIDGVAEATASISKVFSGYVSDRIGRRKPFILLGYGLGAASKPLFALAGSAWLVLGARFADRIGKGLRGAPRDALIADVTPETVRGRAFGLRQALDTAGAFIGPLAAIVLMALLAGDFRAVFWIAVIPGAIAALVVLFGVEDKRAQADGAPPMRLGDLARLPPAFWYVVLVGVVFTFARFSEAFLILRGHDQGLPAFLAPLVLIVMNVVYSIGAYPAGALADAQNPRNVLLAGVGVLVLADLTLAFAPGVIGVLTGVALWGAHMALTQGLFAKLVADTAPASLRGSAFGLFNLASGLALLAASVIAGLVWDKAGATATYLTGATLAAAAALLLLWRRCSHAHQSD
jgi:MFS family permease